MSVITYSPINDAAPVVFRETLSSGGTDLELVVANPVIRKGPRIVFVHGMWHGAWCWEEHFVEYFVTRGFPVAAFSFRGHGESGHAAARRKSPWGCCGYGVRDYEHDLHVVLDRFDHENVVLVGHSLGGYVVQLALQKREVDLAVLLASLPPWGILSATTRFARRHASRFLKTLRDRNLRYVTDDPQIVDELMLSQTGTREDAASLCRRLGQESFRAFVETLLPHRIRPADVWTPVAVIASDCDAFLSKKTSRALARAYAVTPQFVSGGGHDMMLDRMWRTTARKIEEHLETLVVSRAP